MSKSFVTCDMCSTRQTCSGNQRCSDNKRSPSHAKGQAPGDIYERERRSPKGAR